MWSYPTFARLANHNLHTLTTPTQESETCVNTWALFVITMMVIISIYVNISI